MKAAGILYRVKTTGAVLLLQRSGAGDFAGTWCCPGGKRETDETAAETALREAREEAGLNAPGGELKLLTRRVAPTPGGEDVDFTTFLLEVDAPFDVVIDDESVAFAWADPANPPEPLHPGARVALAKLTANELDVARMMAAGEITSPQFFANMMLLDLRITGTGVAYRKAHDEYCYRAPENYLNDDFLARCNGLPVLWEHPAKATLDSAEYADRNVGSVFLPYVKGNEVWAIAKIFDQMAINELTNGENWSTSPTVDFGAGVVLNNDCETVTLSDGTKLLLEGKPPLLDHVAICAKGVWDKGGAPAGVNTAKADSMDEKEMADAIAKADAARKDAEEKFAKADAARSDAETCLAKLADSMDAMSKRMDAWDDEKKREDKARKDAEEEAKKANEAADEPGAGDPEEVARKAKADKAKADKAKADEDEEEKKREDKARKDAEEKAKMADAARADSENASLRAEIDELKRRFSASARSDEDLNALGAAQARADAVYHLVGKSAPRPYPDESLLTYRRRIANDLKAHSKTWNKTDCSKLPDGDTFAAVENGIYADAETALRDPATVPDGELRPVVRRHGNIEITEYHGQPRAWMGQFGGYRGSVKAFSAPTAG